jgi:hypothetical protein
MSANAVTDWLALACTHSLSDPAGAGSYPHDSGYGVLFAQGFTTSTVTVLKYRPADGINIQTAAAIVLNPVEEIENGIPGQLDGPNYRSEHTYDIELLWLASFLGANPTITPANSDEAVTTRRFNLMVDRFKETLRRSMFQLTAPGNEEFWEYDLVDADTGEHSRLSRRMQKMRTVKQPATLAKNGKSRLYGAMVTVTYLEEI